MIARLFISQIQDEIKQQVNKTLVKELQEKLPHPDVLYFEAGDKLGVEQTKQIKDHFSTKPFSAKGKVVVLENASALTIEAQNSLLKILEEPPEPAIILLGAQSEQDLLPTVISRCQVIFLNQNTNQSTSIDIEPLLKFTIDERFHYLEKLQEKTGLLPALIIFWRERLLKNPTPATKKFVSELLEAEKWANQNVNLRATLEYLMLIMPIS